MLIMNQVYYDEYGNKKVITEGGSKVFYDEDGNKLLLYLNRGIINYGEYGIVYKLSEDKCIKYVTNDSSAHPEVLKKIMDMDLKSFYKIYKLLHDKYDYFAGYIMKYYNSEEIDITTMPVSYTLDNFRDICYDTTKLSDSKIYMKDTHMDNVIINRDKTIIIDADNFHFTDNEYLQKMNMERIYNLFIEMYIDHIHKYHKPTMDELRVIRRLFNETKNIYDELSGYKYPIDYIKKKSLEPFTYVMKKGM